MKYDTAHDSKQKIKQTLKREGHHLGDGSGKQSKPFATPFLGATQYIYSELTGMGNMQM